MKKTFAILTLALFLASCDDSTTSKTTETKREPSAAEKIAVLDNIYDTTDIKAIRIKTLLGELSERYAEPQDSIAEYTYRTQSVLHDKGIPETCLGVLEQMHKVNKMENMSYKDAVTMYLLVRANQ